MSRIFISILLLFLTFSLYGQGVEKKPERTSPKKEVVNAPKGSEVKKDESKEAKTEEEKKAEAIEAQAKAEADAAKAKAEADLVKAKADAKVAAEKAEAEAAQAEKAKVEAAQAEKAKAAKAKAVQAEKAKAEEAEVIKTELAAKKKEHSNSLDAKLEAKLDDGSVVTVDKKYGVSVVLDSALGQGTFVSNEYARNPLFTQTLVLVPSYKDWGFSFSLNISASMEYTDSDSTTHANQIMFSDLALSAARPIYSFDDLGLSISASLGVSFPTSLVSQLSNLLFAPMLSLQVAETLGKFSASYAVSFKKNFNRYTTPTINADDLSDFNTYHRSNGVELLEADIISTGSNNVSFSLSNVFALNYSITEKISTGINFAYSQAWVYRSFDDDELTADNASTGRSFRDVIMGGIDLSWQINKTFGLSLGVITAQLPKTSDQKGYRFPWFNFSTPADNLSMFFLDINATF